MSDLDHSTVCERANDLVSVLYGEASERERRDFEVHLQQCVQCRAEFAAFAQVRESIGEWRDEALSGFVSAHTPAAPVRKSALTAWRQFFDLSPLWLKGAVGFAVVVFCVLAVLAVWRSGAVDKPTQVATVNADAVYTKQDLDRAVQEALAKQQNEQREDQQNQRDVAQQSEQRETAQRNEQRDGSPKPVVERRNTVASPNLVKSDPRARRPFSKAERAQLAAELRLISSDDDVDLELLDDRINKQR